MTRRLLPIRTVLEGKDWLGQLNGGKSFTVKRTLLIASMGELLTPEELETVTAVTGRTEAPLQGQVRSSDLLQSQATNVTK